MKDKPDIGEEYQTLGYGKATVTDVFCSPSTTRIVVEVVAEQDGLRYILDESELGMRLGL